MLIFQGNGKVAVFGKVEVEGGTPAQGAVFVKKLIRDPSQPDGTDTQQELYQQATLTGESFATDVSITSDGNHLVVLSGGNGCQIDYYRRNTTTGDWLKDDTNTPTKSGITYPCDTNGGMNGATKIEISDDGKTIVVAKPNKVRVYMINADMDTISYTAGTDDIEQPAGTGTNNYDYGADIDVSANGKTIIVGAPNEKRETTDAGATSAVHILRYDAAVTSGSKWVAKIVYGDDSQWNFMRAADNKDSDFGESVSMSADGNYFAVGAPFAMNGDKLTVGGVVVFTQQGTDAPVRVGDRFYGAEAGDAIGDEVELHWINNVAVVGMTSDSADKNSTDGADNDNHGRINVFRWDPNEDQWEGLEPLFGSGNNDQIGKDFALSADGTELVTTDVDDTAYWYEYFWDTESVSDDAKTWSAVIGATCFAVGIVLL